MWRSKAGLIFRRVSSALNTPSNTIGSIGSDKVRIAATVHHNQVVSAIPIFLYSSAPIFSENIEYPGENATSEIPFRIDTPQIENVVTLENSKNPNPVKKFDEEAEKMVSILKKKWDVEEMEAELETLGLQIGGKLIAKVLKTSRFKSEQFVRFFSWAIRQPDYVPSSEIMDSIVAAICNKGEKKAVGLLKNLIEEVAENHKGVVTTWALNILISHLGRTKKGEVGLEVLKKFDSFECKPDPRSYFVTIKGLCASSIFDEAFSVLQEMEKAGHLPGNKGSYARKVIRLFCKFNRPQEAHKIYIMSMEKETFPGQDALYALVDSLCGVEGTPEVAVEVLKGIPSVDRDNALKSHSMVVRVLCKSKRIEEAQALLSEMVEVGPRPDHSIYNAIITALCKAEKVEEAIVLLEQMPHRRLKPDIYAYNIIMASYAREGKMQEACDVFSKAKDANLNLPLITYKILIDGFCRLGEPKKAHRYFSYLKDSGLSANKQIYSNLIRAYSIQGLDWHTANELLCEMEEKGLNPSLYTQSLVHAMKELVEESLHTVLTKT